MATIEQLASVVRSKNAEPFFTTIDIYFSDSDAYRRVKESGVITTARVAEAYNIPEEAVYGIFFVDVIEAVKVTVFKYNGGKYVGQGDPDNMDMFGCQQYIPMLEVEIDSADA
jgi:hypothetical protein